MSQLILLLAAAALMLQGSCRVNAFPKAKIVQKDTGGNVQRNAPSKHAHKFLHLTQKPADVLEHKGGSVQEITCEAVGSPAPTVQWLKNDQPIYEIDLHRVKSSPSSLGRVSSTLRLGMPTTESVDTYRCIVVAGQKMLSSTTAVYTTASNPDLSERYRLTPMGPKISTYYKIFLDTINTSVTLPCSVKGHPKPAVTWTDNNNDPVYDRNPKMKVLKTGELLINDLSWADMGEYTCTAKNSFGKESVTTFVYPVKAS